MIVWTSDVETEDSVAFKDLGIRSWRWKLEVVWLGVELYREMMADKIPWHPTLTYFTFCCTPFYWKFGGDSMYYDTKHYSLSFGPFHLSWAV